MNEISIYGDIGESFWGESITASSVKDLLEGMEGELTVRINSGGGDVFDGFAIYNLLNQYDGEVTVKIDALAASAASVIAMAGDNIEIADNALLMVHNPWTLTLGESKDMIKTAELLDKIRDSIVTTYQARTGLETDTLSAMMDEETWLNADEALAQGFATIKTEDKAVMNKIERPWMNKAPEVKDDEPNLAFLNTQKRRLKLLKADA